MLKKTFLSNLKPLLAANGIDFDAIIEKTRSAGQAKLDQATALRGTYNTLMAQAKATRKAAEDAASGKVGDIQTKNQALYDQADDARSEASELIKTAGYFSRKAFGPSPKYVSNLLSFLGHDPASVIKEMTDSGNAKIAQAEALESQAADALEAAQKTEGEAYDAALAAYNKAVADAGVKVADAAALEAAGKQLIKSAGFFTIK
jgi:hypothetical protein